MCSIRAFHSVIQLLCNFWTTLLAFSNRCFLKYHGLCRDSVHRLHWWFLWSAWQLFLWSRSAISISGCCRRRLIWSSFSFLIRCTLLITDAICSSNHCIESNWCTGISYCFCLISFVFGWISDRAFIFSLVIV